MGRNENVAIFQDTDLSENWLELRIRDKGNK